MSNTPPNNLNNPHFDDQIIPQSKRLSEKNVLLTPPYHDDIVCEIRRAQNELNVALIDAYKAGIKAEVEVFDFHSIGSKVPQAKIEIKLYKEIK